MITPTIEQKKIFEEFKRYPWLEDKVFQSGVHTILRSMIPTTNIHQDTKAPINADYDHFRQDSQNTMQLLRAKHFYYSKFKQPFDFEQYLAFELEQQRLQNEAKYERMEKYDFDGDENYIKGLPNIIKNWVQQQVKDNKTAKLWDKAHLDAEFAKAKAFYYSACIEPVDVIDYLTWKSAKEQKEEPVCPFANLWQNKGKADLGPQVIANDFLSVEASKFGGPTTITLASPLSQNMVTVERLKQLEEALNEACKVGNNDVTSVLMTATIVDNSDQAAAMDDRIGTKDTKVISSGLAYEATYRHLKQDSNRAIQALDYLGASYYNFVRHQHLQRLSSSTNKPIFTFINGQIPCDLSYVALWHGYLRVATEHALLQCDLKPSHAPIPPLLLFQLSDNRIKSNGKPILPAGWDVYLALAPPDMGRLRAPELLRLGLVDVFVPETQLSDVFSNAKRMALCPPPLTSTAIQLALAMHQSYPGPERISTWQKEISQVFGGADTSLYTIISQLKQMDNPWSRSILNHWTSLPPTLIKVVLKAARLARTMSPLKVLDLEEQLNRQWRHTSDYQQFLRGETNWQGALEEEGDDALVDFYFGDHNVIDDSKDEPFVYQVSEKDLVMAPAESVCPVTGQRGGKNNMTGCPMATQRSSVGNEDVCPVSGQKSDSGAAAVCPMFKKQQLSEASLVTGQASSASSSGCPFPPNHNKNSDNIKIAVCPVTGQSNGACPGNTA